MTPTGQDGEGLVSEEMVERAREAAAAVGASDPTYRLVMRATPTEMRCALAAVATDIAADVERRVRLQAGQLASALNVALAWHDGRATGSAEQRASELDGCRIALDEWLSSSGRAPGDDEERQP